MGQIVTFGIRVYNQPEVCGPKVCVESQLSLGLDDRTSETSLTSLGDFDAVCVFGLTRTPPNSPHLGTVYVCLG